MAPADPPPAYEPHDSAVLPSKQEPLRDDEQPSRDSVDEVEHVVAVQSPPTGTRLSEFNIFRHAIADQDQILLVKKLRTLQPLGCLSWIVKDDKDDIPHHETNFVSQLTSDALAQALEGSLDRATTSAFQDFVLATTLAYTAWRDQRGPSQRLSVHDLHRTSQLAGSALLHRLDQHIDSDPTLERTPRPTLQALFLVLFGTTLGVAYSTQEGGQPTAASADLTGKAPTESPTLHTTMKERLCHLLADKLALLAGRLWEKVDTAVARGCIVQGCLTGRWNRSGRWVWGNLVSHYTWPPSDRSLDWVLGRPGGTFQPTPRAAMMRCPDVLSPLMPRMDSSDRGKRRCMLVVGPTSHGQHMYARMRTHTGSDGPSLFV